MSKRLQLRFARALTLGTLAYGSAGTIAAQHMPYYQFQRWSTDAGLPQSSVHQILQARDGYLWLATEGGVVRYDGVTFKVFQHANDPSFVSDDVSSIAEDPAGNLWFGTMDGLIEKTTSGTHRFTEADGLPSASIISLHNEANGSLLITTTNGQATFNGIKFQPIGAETADLGTSLQGSTTSANGVHWSWDAQAITAQSNSFTHTWRVTEELPGTRIQAVIVAPSGNAWVGTNRGLLRLTSSDSRAMPMPELSGESILAITRDTEGDLWIGTETSGLQALRPRKFRTEPSLANDEVSCLTQASDGSIWVGTREDGLRHLRIDTAQSTHIDTPSNAALTSPIILSIAAGRQNDLWVGTPDGLNHIAENGRVTRYTSADGLPDDLVRSLLVDYDNSLWIGTRGGLAHLRDGHFQILTAENGLGGNLIGPLFEGPSKQPSQPPPLWVATLTGVSRIQNGSITNYTSAQGLQSNLVTGFASDPSGRLWVSTRDAGLFLYRDNRFIRIAARRLWNDLEGITADQDGMLWLRGRQGVSRAPADELVGCAEQINCTLHLSIYGTADGMGSAELVSQGSPNAVRLAIGSLWFATRKGVSVTDPAALTRNSVIPPVVIQRFTADSDEMATGPGMHTIPSGHNRYTFDFAALSYVAPSKVVYRYRLEGFDQAWSSPEGRRSATYTNLPAGTYIFHVLAANNDGIWNETGASVRFQIEPPVYRRWWFLVLAVLSLAGLIVMLYRLRLRRLRRDFNTVLAERNRIAREIHDTLAQDFVGVSLQLDLITHLLAQQNIVEAREQLKGTRSFVQTGIEEARQSIWNLRSNTAAGSFPSRVKALAVRFTHDTLTIEERLSGAYRVLPSPLEQELLRILQEALHNIERHASATIAHIRITYGQDTLVMIISDNGSGFSMSEAEARQGHFGLRGMRERAANIGATLEITSTTGEGTSLKLTVPIATQRDNHP